jgi:transcriptional regulator with XRE-family HTH domain
VPGANPKDRQRWQADFGRRLRAIRIERALSQMDLAHAANYHPTYISDIELGRRNVSLSTMRQLARALRVSTSEFFD